MSKNIKHINYFILTFALVLFSIATNAQEVRVIDNKGTRQTVKSNTVTVSTDADAIQNIPDGTFPVNPVDNDTFIYKPDNGEKVYYVYDGTEWNKIAPTKAARVFYPPSIAIPASTTGAQTPIELYNLYLAEFSSPVASSSAEPIPTYAADELHYYVTYADPLIFDVDPLSPNKMTVSSTGQLNYHVLTTPTDDNTIINVVFVVK